MSEELKKALEDAKSDEEMKAVAEKYKDEIRQLSDEELDGVAGGIPRFSFPDNENQDSAFLIHLPKTKID